MVRIFSSNKTTLIGDIFFKGETKRWMDVLSIFVLGALLCIYWYKTSYFGIPSDFWKEAEDANYFTLGHALNMDFWVFGEGPRVVGNSEIVHPGILYQIVSWLAYRLSAPNLHDSPEALVNLVFRDPSWLWPTFQIIPLIMTLVTFVSLWQMSKHGGLLVAVITSTIFMVSQEAFCYNVWYLFNESFAPLMAVVFFPVACWALSAETRRPITASILLGLIGALVYSQKLTYITWDVAAILAFVVAAFVGALTWRQSLSRIGIFLVTAMFSFLAVGWMFFGRNGLKLMFDNQLMYFVSAGAPGGPKTVISFDALTAGGLGLCRNEPALALIIVVSLLSFIGILLANFREKAWLRQHLPEGMLVMAALAATTLGVMKIYVGYYILAISPVLPFVVLWFVRAGHRRVLLVIFPVLLFGLLVSATNQYTHRKEAALRSFETSQDVKEIKERPLTSGRIRLWVYLIPVPEITRQLLLQFTTLPNLEKIIEDFQGPEYLSSPWHNGIQLNNTYTDISKTNWQYQIVDKSTLIYMEREQRDKHPWLDDPTIKRTEFKRLVLFERP